MGAGAPSEPRQTHTFPAPDSGRWCGAGRRLAVLEQKGHARPAGDAASLSGLRVRLCPERSVGDLTLSPDRPDSRPALSFARSFRRVNSPDNVGRQKCLPGYSEEPPGEGCLVLQLVRERAGVSRLQSYHIIFFFYSVIYEFIDYVFIST